MFNYDRIDTLQPPIENPERPDPDNWVWNGSEKVYVGDDVRLKNYKQKSPNGAELTLI